jgi:hypothetical protein
VNQVRFPNELDLIAKSGVTVWRLADVLEELKPTQTLLPGAADAHLVDLFAITAAVIENDKKSR